MLRIHGTPSIPWVWKRPRQKNLVKQASTTVYTAYDYSSTLSTAEVDLVATCYVCIIIIMNKHLDIPAKYDNVFTMYAKPCSQSFGWSSCSTFRLWTKCFVADQNNQHIGLLKFLDESKKSFPLQIHLFFLPWIQWDLPSMPLCSTLPPSAEQSK